MATPPGLRPLAAAALLTVLGVASVAWASFGSTDAQDVWMGVGVAMLAGSGLLHWLSSKASR